MTYMQYRLVLICFLLVFIVSALSRHFIQIETIAMLFPVYAFVLTCWLLLFFFLLYARKNLQLSGNETFAPAKVLSAVVAMLVFVSIAYPVAMSVVYKTVKDAEGQYLHLENTLGRIERAATDSSMSASTRANAASLYYKCSGRSINYIDGNNQSKIYIQNEEAIAYWNEFKRTSKQIEALYNFMVVSSILSLLSGLLVAVIYFVSTKKRGNEIHITRDST